MSTKSQTRSDYSPDGLHMVRSACLDLAICLNDYWDELVVVGGFVPSLLVKPKADVEAHLGTNDIDIGLALSLAERKRYEAIVERLRTVGYRPDVKETGESAHHRWKLYGFGMTVTVDFLIENPADGKKPGKPLNLAKEFGPIRNDALPAAFLDRVEVELAGNTPRGEDARRVVQVCGAAGGDSGTRPNHTLDMLGRWTAVSPPPSQAGLPPLQTGACDHSAIPPAWSSGAF